MAHVMVMILQAYTELRLHNVHSLFSKRETQRPEMTDILRSSGKRQWADDRLL